MDQAIERRVYRKPTITHHGDAVELTLGSQDCCGEIEGYNGWKNGGPVVQLRK